MKELENAMSPTGKVIVFVERLMEEFARRSDGSVSTIRQDTKFDNHNKMTTTGIVVAGTHDGGVEVIGDKDMIMPRSSRFPAGYEFSSVFKPEINPGDRVWFHYLCGENKALIQPTTGGWYISMNAADVFCILPKDDKNAPLKWNFMYCAGDEIIEDDRNATILDARGNPIKVKVKPSQGLEIIVGLFAKPMVAECKIWGIGETTHRINVSSEVKPGDHVYLAKDSEFSNYILDHQTWIFKHSDILGHVKRQPKDTIPVGKFHLVKIAIDDYKTEQRHSIVKDDLTGHKAALIHRTPILVVPNRGTIERSGKLCTHGAVDEKIVFSTRFMKMLDRHYWLIHDDEIQAKI